MPFDDASLYSDEWMNQTPTIFNSEKSLQMAIAILRISPNKCLGLVHLMKLMYISDRNSLRRLGRPISGDRSVAMKHGPVLITAYNATKGQYHDSSWTESLTQFMDHQVKLAEKPTTLDELSPAELEVIGDTVEEYRAVGEWELVELTHQFPEWIKHWNEAEQRGEVIPMGEILDAVGRSVDRDLILAELADRAEIDRILQSV